MKTKGIYMYILAAAGGPSFIFHGLVALGATIVAFAVETIKKIRHA